MKIHKDRSFSNNNYARGVGSKRHPRTKKTDSSWARARTYQVPVEGFNLDKERIGPHQPHEDLQLKNNFVINKI